MEDCDGRLVTNDTDLQDVAHEWVQSSDEALAALEQQHRNAPADVALRAKLIGAYFLRDGDAQLRRQRHILWLVEHAPKASLLASGYARLYRPSDRRAFKRAAAFWRRHLKGSPNDLVLMENAAAFVAHGEPRLAEQLYRRGALLDSANPKWADRLGRVYSQRVRTTSGAKRRVAARAALKYFEKAWRLTRGGRFKFYVLNHLAEMAFAAEEFSKATRYSRALLRGAKTWQPDWNVGNAIYRGNEILGLIALKRGQVLAAKRHLIAAGKTPGSPQLNSFGPEFDLARQFVRRGEWSTVEQFLRNVRVFWESGRETLARWLADIAAHRPPDFDER